VEDNIQELQEFNGHTYNVCWVNQFEILLCLQGRNTLTIPR
jgi:hypothetical protein